MSNKKLIRLFSMTQGTIVVNHSCSTLAHNAVMRNNSNNNNNKGKIITPL